jgi:proline iminopeptidase
MKLQRLLFSITAAALFLQSEGIAAGNFDNALCMWDTPIYPPGSSKGHYTPPSLPQNTPRETSWKRIGGANIRCESIGKGNPVIVIHGGPGMSHDYLLPGMEMLAKDHQVVFYDQRGCGQSGGLEEPLEITLERYVADVEGIRKAYGFERPSIVGHSWGGYVAMNYAIAYPDYVDKLVLVNPIPSTPQGMGSFMSEYERRMAPLKEKLDCMVLSPEYLTGDPAVTEDYYKTIFQTYVFDNAKVKDLNLKTTPSAALNNKQVQEIFAPILADPRDLTDDLKKLKIPTLIVSGDVDVVPAFTAEETSKSIPGSKFILIRNCGHFPFVEKPEIFNDTIGNFIR